MRLFRRRKNRRDCDWGFAFGDFLWQLYRLREHLAGHDMYVGVEDDVAGLDYVLALGAEIAAEDGWCEFGDGDTLAVRLQAWDDEFWDPFWDSIRGNMRGWWC